MIILNQVGKGTYKRASNFSRHLAKRGHRVTLMAMSPTSRLRFNEQDLDGVQLVETPDFMSGPLRSGWDPWDVLRRAQWVRTRSFDLVHAVEARPVVLFPALVARQRGAKLVMDWCDWFGRGGSVEERPSRLVRTVLRPVETFFEERFRTCADGTVVINPFLGRRAIQLGVRPETVRVIRHGADTDVLPVSQATARSALGLADRLQLIGYVGTIYTHDAQLMAAAFNRVHSRLPNARLLLVGYFNRHIEPWLDDPSAVIRTGWVTSEQVYQYLAASDLCWLPLRDSGANRGRWPSKLNDYMAVGRPVVAVGAGELVELIPRYQLGVATQEDADDLAAQTVALLTDGLRCQVLGEKARRAAEEVFSWTQVTDELEDFYRQVLDQQ
jgi:glycosyltransferase involved in cell wall biosynthesis